MITCRLGRQARGGQHTFASLFSTHTHRVCHRTLRQWLRMSALQRLTSGQPTHDTSYAHSPPTSSPPYGCCRILLVLHSYVAPGCVAMPRMCCGRGGVPAFVGVTHGHDMAAAPQGYTLSSASSQRQTSVLSSPIQVQFKSSAYGATVHAIHHVLPYPDCCFRREPRSGLLCVQTCDPCRLQLPRGT